jgi:hypothetical protein
MMAFSCHSDRRTHSPETTLDRLNIDPKTTYLLVTALARLLL